MPTAPMTRVSGNGRSTAWLALQVNGGSRRRNSRLKRRSLTVPEPLHRLKVSRQLEMEKTDYSVAGNPNFASVVAALGPCHFVAFGVTTEYCVRHSVLALRKLNFTVDLVVDAVRSITQEGGREAIDEMLAAGARLVTTEEVCSGSLQPQAIVGAGNG